MNLLQQLDAIFTVQAGLVFAVVMICLLCVHNVWVDYTANKAAVKRMLEEAYAMNEQFDQYKWFQQEAEDCYNGYDLSDEDHYTLHGAEQSAAVVVPCISYNDWLVIVKELGGYFIQPDEGDSFYVECWQSGHTPQKVTDYLNQPF